MPVGHDYTLTFSSSTMYSSKYVNFLAIDRPNNDNYQKGYAKVDLGLTLRSPNDRWEIAVIGKNVNDKIVAGACSAANFAGSSVLGGEVTGGTTRGPAGIDEVGCYSDPGREVWLRLTVKPFE
jgi:iron complex outermembrane receptor protein